MTIAPQEPGRLDAFYPIPCSARVPPLWALPLIVLAITAATVLVMIVLALVAAVAGADMGDFGQDWRKVAATVAAALLTVAGLTVACIRFISARAPPLWALPLIVLAITAATVLVIIILGLVAALAGADMGDFGQDWRKVAATVTAALLTVAGLTAAWIRFIERRPLASAGLQRFSPRGEPLWFGGGLLFALLSTAVIAAATGAGAESRALWPTLIDAPGRLLPAAALMALLLLPNSIAEELLFRGWALSAIARRRGQVWAVAATSIAFGAAHVPPTQWADPARLLSFISYSAVGVGFAAMALRRRSLYAPIAFHTGFNTLLLTGALADAGMSPPKLLEGLTNSPLGTEDLREAAAWLVLNLVFAGVLVWRWRRRAAPEADEGSTPASA